MIIGKIHPGSGLGDQLFSYITTRTIALDRGFDFGFVGKEFFKGKDFMQLDWGIGTDLKYHIEDGGKLVITNDDPDPRYWHTKLWEAPLYYDPEVNFIEDGTVIDGCSAQDERYWGHRLNEIREWLKVEPRIVLDDICVVNFRGGEYTTVPDLFLPQEYWNKAMDLIKEKYPNPYFSIHTDDIETVAKFFPSTERTQNIEMNWRAIRYAKHLIISNSAFAILPALLNENVKEVIAPRYWAGRNVGEWRRPQNYYKKFQYI